MSLADLLHRLLLAGAALALVLAGVLAVSSTPSERSTGVPMAMLRR